MSCPSIVVHNPVGRNLSTNFCAERGVGEWLPQWLPAPPRSVSPRRLERLLSWGRIGTTRAQPPKPCPSITRSHPLVPGTTQTAPPHSALLHHAVGKKGWIERSHYAEFVSDKAVGATGLEPAVSCSQSRRASHYATPRLVDQPGQVYWTAARTGQHDRCTEEQTPAAQTISCTAAKSPSISHGHRNTCQQRKG